MSFFGKNIAEDYFDDYANDSDNSTDSSELTSFEVTTDDGAWITDRAGPIPGLEKSPGTEIFGVLKFSPGIPGESWNNTEIWLLLY